MQVQVMALCVVTEKSEVGRSWMAAHLYASVAVHHVDDDHAVCEREEGIVAAVVADDADSAAWQRLEMGTSEVEIEIERVKWQQWMQWAEESAAVVVLAVARHHHSLHLLHLLPFYIACLALHHYCHLDLFLHVCLMQEEEDPAT